MKTSTIMNKLLWIILSVIFFSCSQESDELVKDVSTTRSSLGFTITSIGPDQIKISWPINAYNVKQISITNRYNTYNRLVMKTSHDWNYTNIVLLSEAETYRIDIEYTEIWNHSDITQHEILYYKVDPSNHLSEIVYESWVPSCLHDFSGFASYLLYERTEGSITIDYECRGEYVLIARSIKNPSSEHREEIIHTSSQVAGTFTMSIDSHDNYDIRIYSKDCSKGYNKCNHYLQFLTSTAPNMNYKDTFYWSSIRAF